ncbi:hypothetical protein RvY_04319 [Ramazzottius varieornatus]|uniref:Uncharacterized protein n=1 Tax=Ramazzottius varieornatus TaxID=947166 RepID=A0A1D1UY37_RAMVA|nr:hypothetical protein RvY_04319 [Ramazzottius varieornatus]
MSRRERHANEPRHVHAYSDNVIQSKIDCLGGADIRLSTVIASEQDSQQAIVPRIQQQCRSSKWGCSNERDSSRSSLRFVSQRDQRKPGYLFQPDKLFFQTQTVLHDLKPREQEKAKTHIRWGRMDGCS